MYSFQSRVRYSETGADSRMTLHSILDYFQDCSTFHSEDLGVGIRYLAEKKRLWVLSAWQIVVGRYPQLGERIKIVTFPYGFRGFMGSRNFYMEDGQGEKAAWANSIWTLLDTQTGLPVRVDPELEAAYRLEEKLSMDYAPRKIALPEDMAPREAFTVGRMHIDSNHHVNNGQYIRMASEYLPEGFTVRQMRAEYKKQAVLGDVIEPFVFGSADTLAVVLAGADGQTFAAVEFKA